MIGILVNSVLYYKVKLYNVFMIITDSLKSFLKPPHEVIKSKHLQAWSDLTHDKDGSELKAWINNPLVTKFYFDTGWLFFALGNALGGRNVSHIYSMYRHPKSKETRQSIIDTMREFYKANNIETVTMQSTLPMEFWEKNYECKFIANLMEIKV